MAVKQTSKARAPNVQYASAKRVRDAAKLALILHGAAFRELANR